MIATVHFTAGAVIGSRLGNPFLAFIFGFLIHFILDAIPHKDYYKDKWTRFEYLFLLSDFLFLFLLIFFIFQPELKLMNPFFWGGLGGIIPDILVVLTKNNFIGKKLINIHKLIHSNKQLNFWSNFLLQTSLLFLFYLIK